MFVCSFSVVFLFVFQSTLSLSHLSSSVSPLRRLAAPSTSAPPVPGDQHRRQDDDGHVEDDDFDVYDPVGGTDAGTFDGGTDDGCSDDGNLVECLMPRLTLPPILLPLLSPPPLLLLPLTLA